MTITDYDAPRRPTIDLGTDSIEEIKVRAATKSPTADVVETDSEVFELPGADLSGEELTVTVVPMLNDEFRCSRCFLVRHRSQRARAGDDLCLECA